MQSTLSLGKNEKSQPNINKPPQPKTVKKMQSRSKSKLKASKSTTEVAKHGFLNPFKDQED